MALALQARWISRDYDQISGVLGLRSRNDNDFSLRYPSIATALSSFRMKPLLMVKSLFWDKTESLPLICSRIHGSTHADVFYYVFDLMILRGKDLREETLERDWHCWKVVSSPSFLTQSVPVCG